jgi:hypothetical protein
MALLAADPDPHVRTMACEVVGAWVRKKASWYAPGGPIFQRTQPARSRRGSAAGRTRPW